MPLFYQTENSGGDDFFIKYRRYILAAILLLAAFLIFFRLTRADIQHDDGHYLFRAAGYLDFMDSDRQTTPVDWFDEIPWWSRLSFHEAPPLYFLVHYLFFRIFDVSGFIAHLPCALAGFFVVFLLYLLVKRIYNEKTALLAAFLLSISSYHVWSSRVAYLEPLALVFILLALLFFLKGLENSKFFLLFGVFAGGVFLTKYTAFFILPAVLFYLLLKNRKVLVNKYLIGGIVITFLLFSPVIFYNLKVYQARGHFDLQFASLLGQKTDDWLFDSGGIGGKTYFTSFLENRLILKDSFSRPFYVLILISIFYLFFRAAVKKKDDLFLFLILLFIFFQFTLITGNVRYLILANPFLALALALFLLEVFQFSKIPPWPKLKTAAFIFLFAGFCLLELFYNLNTNVFLKPFGQKGFQYSIYRWENGGFNQLEEYLRKIDEFKNVEKIEIKKMDDFIAKPGDYAGRDFYLFDPNLNWFSAIWYFKRWAVYDKINIVSLYDFALGLEKNKISNWYDVFKTKGVKDLYYIKGLNDSVFDAGNRQPVLILLAQNFENDFIKGRINFDLIFNNSGELAFKVYKAKIN